MLRHVMGTHWSETGSACRCGCALNFVILFHSTTQRTNFAVGTVYAMLRSVVCGRLSAKTTRVTKVPSALNLQIFFQAKNKLMQNIYNVYELYVFHITIAKFYKRGTKNCFSLDQNICVSHEFSLVLNMAWDKNTEKSILYHTRLF
jgi:hypothetical protein